MVALDPGQREMEETEGVSRLAAGSVLPFHSGSTRTLPGGGGVGKGVSRDR